MNAQSEPRKRPNWAAAAAQSPLSSCPPDIYETAGGTSPDIPNTMRDAERCARARRAARGGGRPSAGGAERLLGEEVRRREAAAEHATPHGDPALLQSAQGGLAPETRAQVHRSAPKWPPIGARSVLSWPQIDPDRSTRTRPRLVLSRPKSICVRLQLDPRSAFLAQISTTNRPQIDPNIAHKWATDRPRSSPRATQTRPETLLRAQVPLALPDRLLC